MRRTGLNTFDLEVLHALGSVAVSGAAIREHIKQRTHTAPSVGAVYLAVERLKAKGLATENRNRISPAFSQTAAGKRFLDNVSTRMGHHARTR